MKQIEILSLTRFNTYFELIYLFRYQVPESLKLPADKARVIAKTYTEVGSLDIEEIDGILYTTNTLIQSFTNDTEVKTILQILEDLYKKGQDILEKFQLKDSDLLVKASFDGKSWNI